jgi:hypothetical protein
VIREDNLKRGMMMKKLVFLATVVLMASAMALAQTNSGQSSNGPGVTAPQSGGHTDAQGDLPGVKEGESQSGKGTAANPSEDRPGAMGTPSTPDQGMSPKDERPGTGKQDTERGTTDDNGSLPAVDPQAAPESGTTKPK